MSEFSVHRTADAIPALGYCLVLDGERIAGGKPDYRGNNHLISWKTSETYGPVSELEAENDKLRKLCKELLDLCYDAYNQEWGWDDDWALAHERAKKLGVDDG